LLIGVKKLDFRMDETFETVEKFLVYMSQICKDQVAIIIEVFSDGPSVALRFIERLFEQCVRRTCFNGFPSYFRSKNNWKLYYKKLYLKILKFIYVY
jgi:hypothetical protein